MPPFLLTDATLACFLISLARPPAFGLAWLGHLAVAEQLGFLGGLGEEVLALLGEIAQHVLDEVGLHVCIGMVDHTDTEVVISFLVGIAIIELAPALGDGVLPILPQHLGQMDIVLHLLTVEEHDEVVMQSS